MGPLKIALFTYSTKPRGGVVHTLNLAEKLLQLNQKVHVYALETDKGFFRKVDVPYTLIPCPDNEFSSIDEKIHAYIQTYIDYLSSIGEIYDIYHAEDCISANALLELRNRGLIKFFLRTVHHIDDFVSESLIKCQLDSIVKPDYLLVVSNYWEKELKKKYSLNPGRITNGVDMNKFHNANGTNESGEISKQKFKVAGCKTVLTIGGIEPRKNTISTLRAFNLVKSYFMKKGERVVWMLGGGETLFDYKDYRKEFFSEMQKLGIKEDEDVFILGNVPEELIPDLYNSGDVFVFPSLKEGWGLVVLEAMASNLPVVASDIEPLKEFLEDGKNSLLISPMDFKALSSSIIRILEDDELNKILKAGGKNTAAKYSWENAAQGHLKIYGEILNKNIGISSVVNKR
ncbi:MAG: MSMEG_0565 family glycosyltransferase [Thermodesulfobacteriota bacterium]